jgi:mono/diheme cytochrome c family protein
MNSKSILRFVLSLSALLAIVTAANAGGWAVITLNDFPDHAFSGTPLNLTFTVRQHGMTPLPGLQPSVSATASGGRNAKARAVAGRTPGEYSAALTLPDPGDWTITITSGFTLSALTLPSLKVVAPGTAAPAAFSPMTRGLRLFTAKGCVGCHTHLEARPERSAVAARVDLTGKRFAPEYLRKFLADPSIKSTDMPNMNLKPDEIELLAAFINKDSKKKLN